MEYYNLIIDPTNNKKYNINSMNGKILLKKYMIGGAIDIEWDKHIKDLKRFNINKKIKFSEKKKDKINPYWVNLISLSNNTAFNTTLKNIPSDINNKSSNIKTYLNDMTGFKDINQNLINIILLQYANSPNISESERSMRIIELFNDNVHPIVYEWVIPILREIDKQMDG